MTTSRDNNNIQLSNRLSGEDPSTNRIKTAYQYFKFLKKSEISLCFESKLTQKELSSICTYVWRNPKKYDANSRLFAPFRPLTYKEKLSFRIVFDLYTETGEYESTAVNFLRPQAVSEPGILSQFKAISYGQLESKFADFLRPVSEYKKKNMKIYDMKGVFHGDKVLKLTQEIQKEKKLSSETKILVHGTSEKGIEGIILSRLGFQDIKTQNGKRYGNGVYFTSDIRYALEYAIKNDTDKQYLLLCDVLIGGKIDTSDGSSLVSSDFRTGGAINGIHKHIYMKPWVYAHSDINIAYVVEL
jgi:hypothetical protein